MALQLFLIITTIVLLFLFKDGIKILFESIIDFLNSFWMYPVWIFIAGCGLFTLILKCNQTIN